MKLILISIFDIHEVLNFQIKQSLIMKKLLKIVPICLIVFL
jgi:hypothetical protein